MAELLSERGHATRLLVRTHPERAPRLTRSETASADYRDPASLDRAFAGVRVALIVSAYGAPGKRAAMHRNAFEAAARAGLEHVVYLSFLGAAPTSKFPYSQDHHLSEQYLREAGVAHTVLRDCLYMDMAPAFVDEHGALRGPAGNGAVAWVAREDVAQSAAAVLERPGPSGTVHELTGLEALTLADTVARLSALVGRPLRYEDESLAQARAWRSRLGAPDWEVDVWIGTYLAIAAGELAQPSDAVQRLTGRAPYAFDDYFRERPELLSPLRGN